MQYIDKFKNRKDIGLKYIYIQDNNGNIVAVLFYFHPKTPESIYRWLELNNDSAPLTILSAIISMIRG